MRRGVQEALFFACCFAAASAVPFLDVEAKARFAALGFGMPPLLMLALAAVTGAASLWLLRETGFFAPGPGSGIGAALRAGTLLAVALIALDAIARLPREVSIGWPAAWLYAPATAVVVTAVLGLVPLATIHALLRRPWPAMAVAAMVAPAARLAVAADMPAWQTAAIATDGFALSFVSFVLLRRHGVVAPLVAVLVHAFWWQVLWGTARLALPSGGP